MNHRWTLKEKSDWSNLVHFSIVCSTCSSQSDIGWVDGDGPYASEIRASKLYSLVGRNVPKCGNVLARSVIEE